MLQEIIQKAEESSFGMVLFQTNFQRISSWDGAGQADFPAQSEFSGSFFDPPWNKFSLLGSADVVLRQCFTEPLFGISCRRIGRHTRASPWTFASGLDSTTTLIGAKSSVVGLH